MNYFIVVADAADCSLAETEKLPLFDSAANVCYGGDIGEIIKAT